MQRNTKKTKAKRNKGFPYKKTHKLPWKTEDKEKLKKKHNSLKKVNQLFGSSKHKTTDEQLHVAGEKTHTELKSSINSSKEPIAYVEFTKPQTPNLALQFDKNKQLWCVETKDLKIIKGLVERHGDITVLDFLKKYGKDVIVLY